jgi:hypothetical protein
MVHTASGGSLKRVSIKKIVKEQSNVAPQLADRMKKVLLFLAKNGEASPYKLQEKCKIGENENMRYSTAHRSIKALELEGLVRLKSETRNAKGAPTTTYALTTKGLHQAIYDLPSWQEKIVVAEKWQSLLNPNVIEWMKFIEALNDQKTEELVNTEIGSFLCCSDDLGFFVDVIDDPFFDALLSTMVIFDESYYRILDKLEFFPRIKDRLLKLLEQDIMQYEDDLRRYQKIKSELQKR